MLYSINYLISILLFSINAENNDEHSLHHAQRKLEPSTYLNDTMNVSTLTRLAAFNQLANYTLDSINELIPGLSSGKETKGNVVFNPEKTNGAVIRRVGASTSSLSSLNIFASLDNATLFASLENTSILALLDNINVPSLSEDENLIASVNNQNFLTSEIKLYAGSSPPRSPWLLCDGSIVSRLEYPRLFSIISTKYGEGYNSTTFRLPDLRGRVPIGVDIDQLRINQATDLGTVGGKASHTLTIEQLPSHVHDSGTFKNSYDGQHTHNLYDPGHNHGGFTSTYAVPSTSSNNYGEYNAQATGYRQWQAYTIETSFSQISIYSNGNHTHELTGHTGTVGQGQSFSTLPPFQTFHYIIYAN